MWDDARKAARLLIDSYGDHAAIVAERRAARLQRDRSEDAAQTWLRIASAIRSIESERTPAAASH